MDQIQESLDRIAELSAEELKSLADSIVTEFGVLETQDHSRETVDSMVKLADAAELVRTEEARRETEAQELSTQAAEAMARIKGEPSEQTVGTPAAESDENAEFSTEEITTVVDAPVESEASVEEVTPASEPVTEFATETTTTTVEAPEDVTVEVTTVTELSTEEAPTEETAVEAELSAVEDETPSENVAELATTELESSEETVTASAPNFEAPEDRRPTPAKKNSALGTITAGADLPGIVAGSELPNLRAVAQALLDRKKGMGRTTGGDGEQALVASFQKDFSDGQFLNSNDYEGNRQKIDEVVSIVAAGGLTAPVDTSYDIFELGETEERPVRDALPSFGADRGGIRFLTPPLLADLNGSVSVWTLQDDIDAAQPGSTKTKPCLRVQAGEEVTVYTDAIPLCLTFGNLGARAYPELVERHIKLAMVHHARFAETRLLTRIGALSTAVTAPAELGAARDIFNQIEVAAAAYRSRYRVSPNAALRVIFPVWFKNALRSDLIKQLPGDGRDGTFNLADAEITKWFRVRNINVTWHLDGETGQIFGAQTAGALLDFPANVIWYMFTEGTFLFLDGGTLDLGLVRDSTLNGTNDYKIFLETFEGVAKIGVESLRVTSALGIYGATAATVDTVGV